MLLLILACTPDDAGTGTPDSSTDTGTGATVTSLALALGDVPTTIVATWSTSAPTRRTITGTFGDRQVTIDEGEAATEHAVVLAGFPASTEVTVRVEAGAESEEATITTGTVASWLPGVTTYAEVPEDGEGGFTVAPVILQAGGGVAIFDDEGAPVWTYPPDEVMTFWPFRARLSLDGRAILYNEPSTSVDLPGSVVRVSLDGGESTRVEVDGHHTDFVEVSAGAYGMLGWEIQEIDDRKILGDTIVERSADGEERLVWSAWDDFEPDLTLTYPNYYPADPEVEDWTHINSLAYDAAEDAYYVSMTFNHGVARIDRASGELTWWVSDDGGDFANVEDEYFMMYPHSVQRIDGGVTVFSRSDPWVEGTCSEVVDLALDEEAWEARRVWSYQTPDCMLVTFLGDAQRLPGGNTLASWTTAGRMSEVTPGGDIAWQVSMPIGAAFGFAERVERLGP